MKLASVVILSAVCLAVVLVLYPAAHLRAQYIQLASPQYVTFGMIGITEGQLARLNALLLPMGGPVVAGSCQVTFTYINDQGTTLASTTLPLTQNQAVHFDYPALPVPIGGAARTQIRGTVQTSFVSTSGSPVPAAPSCSVVPTMEIYNVTTSQTAVVLETTHALPEVIPLTAM